MLYLGLMSGTSLDGLDLALCRFDGRSYSLIKAETVPYPTEWEGRLQGAMTLSAEEFVQLDRDLGAYFGTAALEFLDDTRLKEDLIIASHGHTVFHDPAKGVTVQIGHGPALREASGYPVVWDFRSADVAAGGQGAPLVPVAERDLFSGYEACLNLGGFANITFLSKTGVLAFDICACNTVLNDLANRLGQPFDPQGSFASKGHLLPDLLKQLNELPFYKALGPKSLGREFVQKSIRPLLALLSDAALEDILHTYVEHISWALAKSLTQLPAGSSVLVTGGGAYNTFLLERIRKASKDYSFTIPDHQTISFKEAIAFAYLGYLHHIGQPGNIPSVTGARGYRILGTYCP